MKRLLEVGGDVKAKKARRERVKGLMGANLDELSTEVKVCLIQDLIPLGLMHVVEVLQQEVKALAGDRYKRDGQGGHVRWSRQWGSIYLGEQKVPVLYQRVRDRHEGREVELSTCRALQEPRGVDEGLLGKILLGLSCRDYERCTGMVPEAFGLSSSTVFRRFIKASSRKLKEFDQRRWDDVDVVGIVMDGKSFKDDEMIIALGVTAGGRR